VTHHLFPGAATLADGTPWEQRYPELPEHYDRKWYSPEFTAEALARQGFDQAFLYPSLGLYLPCFDGMGALGIECCRVYNDWLLEFCSFAPQVLKPVALVSLHDLDLAIHEVRRTAALGFAAACLARLPDGRTSADPDLEPFWTTCEQLGVLVSFHPVTSNVYLDNQPLERPASPFEFFNCNMFAQHFANLLISGVLERHPRLRIALLESGCGWLPSVLWRLQRVLFDSQKRNDLWGHEIPRLLVNTSREELAQNVRMPPVDYFRRQCYIACEAEPFVQEVAHLLGEDRLVFQGDFPHPDHHPSFVEDFVQQVPEGLRRKILWDNPRAMYRQG
jgi:predicted TIM-barrel fold metal-dependent hydrolase